MDLDFHNLPVHDGVSGDWAIETFEVGEIESEKTRLRADYTRDNDAFIPAGCYRRLVKSGEVVMSNTPMEVRTCAEFLDNARGRILINGLGLGMVLHAVLQLPLVTQVTVVERELDVIKLVGDAFNSDPRVEIIHADAFLYCPPAGVVYDSAWHDVKTFPPVIWMVWRLLSRSIFIWRTGRVAGGSTSANRIFYRDRNWIKGLTRT